MKYGNAISWQPAKNPKRTILKNFWLHCVFFIEQRENENGQLWHFLRAR